MRQVARRAVLAGGGIAVAGTLAAAVLIRKPRGPEILHPITGPAEAEETSGLQDMSAIVATNPPAPPPDITFADADGAPHRLSDFKGRGLIVNLWATWCVPCVAELPALDALARKSVELGLMVLPLSSDRGGVPIVHKFYEAHDIRDLGVWVDPKGVAGQAWHARGLPTTVLIDKEGRERGRLEGAADWGSDAALRKLTALLTGPA